MFSFKKELHFFGHEIFKTEWFCVNKIQKHPLATLF